MSVRIHETEVGGLRVAVLASTEPGRHDGGLSDDNWPAGGPPAGLPAETQLTGQQTTSRAAGKTS
ncbi:hypothetical protein ACIBQX_24750 [Nonomuraea sp. NPDC049714]|uniref:hypothetical protein n=1 Tax=Nonomuraea sp. NPDC049714 TaxID=3364357 RepID=UPI0037BAE777